MDEILDIFSEEQNVIGQAPREEVHQKGYWHQTFHCWVVHRTETGDALLLQRRHPSKDTHPNLLDTSCAGHLEAGEGPEDGVRELKEELGLAVPFDALLNVGVYKYSDQEGDIQDNEFCHVFAYVRENGSIEDYMPAMDEVSGLYLVDVEQMKKLCRHEISSVAMNGFEWSQNGDRIDQEGLLSRTDLVKSEDAYYEMLFDAISHV